MEKGNGELQKGLVLRSTGSWYEVEWEGGVIACRVRGKIRLKGARTTNPVAVGDRVLFAVDPDGAHGVIHSIEPRENYIIRRATNLSKESHILGANLDLALLFLTCHAPETPLEFADRFLATAEAYRVPAIVVQPKWDFEQEREKSHALGVKDIYEYAGYRVVQLSSLSGLGVEELRQEMRGKKSLLVGQSGCGKSAFINALSPGLHRPTGELIAGSNLGRHTTTFAEMLPLPSDPCTYVVDSPGIKGFGVIDFQREEIAHFFPDIFRLSAQCHYYNCLHDQEPHCAVIEALERGELPPSRYLSYLSLLHDDHARYR